MDEQDLIDAIQKGHAALDARAQISAEREVLEMLVKGLSSKQIAGALGLSPRTVESHRAAIAAKAGTSSTAELTRYWLEAQAAP